MGVRDGPSVRPHCLDSRVELHDAPASPWRIGAFTVTATTVVHPGPTLGYRVAANGAAMAYVPDHEPALGGLNGDPAWTSGYDLAANVDLLLHDGQYTAAEYASRVGWGHSSIAHAVAFAELAGARRLALFHHDPDHDDESLDRLVDEAWALSQRTEVVPGCEGTTFEV